MTRATAARQQGAILLIAMIMLLLVTLLAITGMRNTVVEEKLVGYSRDRLAAVNGVDSALREAETRLALNPGPPSTTANCSDKTKICLLASLPKDLRVNDWDWWRQDSNAMAYQGNASGATELYRLNEQPRWQAAVIGFDPANSNGLVEVTDINERRRGIGPYYYQVNATSPGYSSRLTVTGQSTDVQRY
ncbi:MAG: PilX N-terminal domain-containing pilus assembly protein [Pseudomonas oryzihabitans]